MLLTLAIAAAIVSPAPLADGPVCPVAGSPISIDSPAVDYRGVRYQTCCMNCMGAFQKDPAACVSAEKNQKKVVGVSLFDPISGLAITAKKAKGGFSDFAGTRFYFANPGGKTTFDADPKKYGTIPAKESMFCPVLKVDLKNYYGAHGFVDFEGVRYYACCANCFGQMKAGMAKFAPNAAAKVADAKPLSVPAAIVKIQGG